MKRELFVGVTTWNSELFLEHCLRSIHKTTDGLQVRIGVAEDPHWLFPQNQFPKKLALDSDIYPSNYVAWS
jgi:hypothetical protein